MDTPIDKLVFALGGDVTALNDAFKQAEASAAKTGKSIQESLGQGFKDAAGRVASDGAAIKSTMSGVEQHVSKVSSHIQVSRREMVYAFRELANGDIQRLPATMALLLSHMLEISPAAIAVGAAIAAVPIAVAVSAAKADEALAKLRTSIALTGNASGVSLSQATSAAFSAAAASGGSISMMGAQRVMGGFIGAGVPRSLLGSATLASGNYALGSGSSQEDSTNMLARALMEPVKGAQELNKTMHLLTAEQTEEVKNLSESGQQEKAAAIILAEFSARSKEAAEAASFWSKSINNMGNAFGNLGHWLGTGVFGTGSTQERIDLLQNSQRARLAAGGFGTQSYQADLRKLEAQRDSENAIAKAKGLAHTANDAVGKGLEDANSGADAFNHKLQEMKNELGRDTWALNQATSGHAKFSKDTIDRLTEQQSAMDKAKTAFEQYGKPGMADARQLGYARQLAGTPLDKEAIVRARQEANEARIREKMDPSTTLQADANYKARMATAGLADADKLKQQQKRLEGMQAEAVGAGKIAAAYDVSTAAVARATAESEVDVEITNKQINAKDRLTAVQTKLNTAFDQARQAIGKLIDQAGIENAATRMELAAGGNPLALMHATASAGAFRDTENAMRLASSPAERADILSHRGRLADSNYEAAQMDARKGAQSTLFGANADLASQRRLYSAQTSGMSDDDLRRFQVWNQLVQDFTKQGLDPADTANRKLFEDTLKTNTALSDLGDEMQKTAEEAKGLADDITGGIGNFLKNPTMNPKDALAGIGQDMLNTIVKANILDPMNKFLTSQFSGLIGGPHDGSSPGSAMYVQMVGAGGLPGLPGAGGADGGGFLNNLLSGTGGGEGSFSNSILRTLGLGGSSSGGGLDSILKAGSGGIFGGDSSGAGLFSFANAGGLNAGLFGGGGAGSFMSSITGGSAALDAMPEISGLSGGLDALISGEAFAGMGAAAGGAAAGGGFLSSLMSFLPLLFLADGGPMRPGQPYMVGEEGPEILQIGSGSGYVTPLTAPSVRAALGSQVGDQGRGGNDITHNHFHLPGVTDVQTFVRSKSQIAAAATAATSQGKRNH